MNVRSHSRPREKSKGQNRNNVTINFQIMQTKLCELFILIPKGY